MSRSALRPARCTSSPAVTSLRRSHCAAGIAPGTVRGGSRRVEGGRFDLNPPRGTCYLGFDELTAIRETVGEALAKNGVISDDFATERQLSTLTVPGDHQLADTCTDEAADFGLTRELASMTPYAVPQEWAAAFDAHFGGIRYQTRFTTGPNPNAVGLFGDAGEASWPIDPSPEPFVAAARRCGFIVASPPRAVHIVPPPVA